MRIGITVFISRKGGSIWSNGAMQHCVFLQQMLLRCPGVDRVHMINGGDGDQPDKALLLDKLGIQLVRFDDVKDEIDLLIECGAQIERSHEEHVHARGGKVIGFRFGNAYVIDTERVIHRQPSGSIMNGTRFDEIWTNEQHMHTCGQYWEVLNRCPVRSLPHIWSPLFVNMARAEMKQGVSFQYQPGRMPRRIAILEPNINIVKTCQIPMLICESLYRRHPELIGEIYVTNAFDLKEHETFARFCQSLDIVKDGICSFEHRYSAPWFIAKHADVVVSHQWENALNYLYYEVLEAGYPLVHSSPMLSGAGYQYDPFDIEIGSRQLELAITRHDDHPRKERSDQVLEQVDLNSQGNISLYSRALSELMSRRLAA